jgi:AcrR family transcriptional regulator
MSKDVKFSTDDLRHAMIIAGIKEIEAHGLSDFSLRRVASECGVSCAAPYRHFKSKSDLISAIISYINDQWSFLERQISEVYKNDLYRLIVELCVANIRFWIANPNFRSIMMMDDRGLDTLQLRERSRISEKLVELIFEYCRGYKADESSMNATSLELRSIIYGSTHMLGSGELENTPESMSLIRSRIEKNLLEIQSQM